MSWQMKRVIAMTAIERERFETREKASLKSNLLRKIKINPIDKVTFIIKIIIFIVFFIDSKDDDWRLNLNLCKIYYASNY